MLYVLQAAYVHTLLISFHLLKGLFTLNSRLHSFFSIFAKIVKKKNQTISCTFPSVSPAPVSLKISQYPAGSAWRFRT